MKNQALFASSLLAAALVTSACGGAKPAGSGPVTGAPAATNGAAGGDAASAIADAPAPDAAPARADVSRDAKSDFRKAADFFAEKEKGAWSSNDCETAASQFRSVAKEHKLVEAAYMAGLSMHRCNQLGDAQKAYEDALRMDPNYGPALSNLGDIYYRQGKPDQAKAQWERAIKAQPKLSGARVGLANFMLTRMRQLQVGSKEWQDLFAAARMELSRALAVEGNNVEAYATYALLYMEGRTKNKNQLDLAKLLIDEGQKINNKNSQLKNALGLYWLYRGALGEAVKAFEEAVALDPTFLEARMNVALASLNFRRYDQAKEQFSAVLAKDAKNYDAMIGLGIAQRGQGDLKAAEESYKKAQGMDPSRADAFYNLGVLYKAFYAPSQADSKQSIANYKTARTYFSDFQSKRGASAADIKEAKDLVKDCDREVQTLEAFMKMQASMPAEPAAPAAPAAAPAPAAKPN